MTITMAMMCLAIVPLGDKASAATYKKKTEKVYIVASTGVYKTADVRSKKLGTVTKNKKITRISRGDNGWSKIIYNNGYGYVKSKYTSVPFTPYVFESKLSDKLDSAVQEILTYVEDAKELNEAQTLSFSLEGKEELETINKYLEETSFRFYYDDFLTLDSKKVIMNVTKAQAYYEQNREAEEFSQKWINELFKYKYIKTKHPTEEEFIQGLNSRMIAGDNSFDYADYYIPGYGTQFKTYETPQGHAKTMKLMMEQAGLEARVVEGSIIFNGKKTAWAWNKVRVNGKWKYFDIMLNIPVSKAMKTTNKKGQKNCYMFLTKTQMMKDHYKDTVPVYEHPIDDLKIEADKGTDPELIQLVKEKFAELPKNLQQAWLRDDNTIYLIDNLPIGLSGLYTGNIKLENTRLQINRSFYHEFGHFLKYIAFDNNNDLIDQLLLCYKQERYNGNLLSHYTNSNSEYFAEIFDMIFTEPEMVKNTYPKSYNFIAKMIYRVFP